MIKLKDILTEKKEMPSNGLQKIAKLTDGNNHTEARRLLSSWMGNDKLMSFYEAMGTLNKVFNGFPPELSKLNSKMEKEAGVYILVSCTAIFKNNEVNIRKNIETLRNC